MVFFSFPGLRKLINSGALILYIQCFIRSVFMSSPDSIQREQVLIMIEFSDLLLQPRTRVLNHAVGYFLSRRFQDCGFEVAIAMVVIWVVGQREFCII